MAKKLTKDEVTKFEGFLEIAKSVMEPAQWDNFSNKYPEVNKKFPDLKKSNKEILKEKLLQKAKVKTLRVCLNCGTAIVNSTDHFELSSTNKFVKYTCTKPDNPLVSWLKR